MRRTHRKYTACVCACACVCITHKNIKLLIFIAGMGVKEMHLRHNDVKERLEMIGGISEGGCVFQIVVEIWTKLNI